VTAEHSDVRVLPVLHVASTKWESGASRFITMATTVMLRHLLAAVVRSDSGWTAAYSSDLLLALRRYPCRWEVQTSALMRPRRGSERTLSGRRPYRSPVLSSSKGDVLSGSGRVSRRAAS